MHQKHSIHGIRNPPNPSQFEMWRDQLSDTFEFEIRRARPEPGLGISKEVLDSLTEQMTGFVAARMVGWMMDNERAGIEGLDVTLRVEVT
jgi:hypothetical protein